MGVRDASLGFLGPAHRSEVDGLGWGPCWCSPLKMNFPSHDWLAALAFLLGPEKVTTAAEILAANSGDKWSASHPPDIVVFAESTADVSAVLKFANEHQIPVTIRGAGFGYIGGAVPVHGGIVLSTARMCKILGIYLKDGVAIVQPRVRGPRMVVDVGGGVDGFAATVCLEKCISGSC